MREGQPTLGVLTLGGKMADVPGCMACEATFPYPVVRKVVEGTSTPRTRAEVRSMLPLYLDAARELEAAGVDVITSNCGLIALLQQELAAAVRVPVMTSSLLMAPTVARSVGGRTIAILTFFDDEVGEENFRASGWSSREVATVVAGVGEYSSWLRFLETKEADEHLMAQLEADLVAVADAALQRHPDIGAFLLECTMLPCAVSALRAAFSLPAYDVLTFLDWAMSGYRRHVDARMVGA